MRTVIALLLLTGMAFGEEHLIGYRQENLKCQGPGEWRHSAEPIWVYDYHTLRLRYRASGLTKTDAPVLTLRPGSVGPVTPGATNIENPFVAGLPVVVLTARDLVSDDKTHTAEIELRGKMRTPQIDQLQFSLPAGSRLEVEDLQFRGDPDVFSCVPAGSALPENVQQLVTRGPSTCAGSPSTSLRGRESIRIEGDGRKGRTLYLSLSAHFAGVTAFVTGENLRSREVKESSETAHAVARVKYADRTEEDQFPLLVAESRHAMLNRKAALYSLEIDPLRPISSIELMDRSPHMQLVLFAAGLSQSAAPTSLDSATLAIPQAANRPVRESSLEGSKWFKLPSGNAIRADLDDKRETGGRRLSLVVTNVSATPQEFTLTFPSVAISPTTDANDLYYLFPRQGAVISRADRVLEATYSGIFPLQFMDVFSPGANSGASVIVCDTSGRWKKFRLRKSGATVHVEVDHLVRLAPGETYSPPDARITQHGGDWREGFEAYRNWLKTWYKAGHHPEWLQSSFWARRDYPVGGTGRLFDTRRNRYTFDEFIKDGQTFGGIDFIDISGWALSQTLGRVGDYPIELGGADDLRRNVTAARKANIPTGLYFEGYLIDKNSRVGRSHGEAWQLIDEKGNGQWWKGGSPELFVCPYVRAWQQYMADRVTSVAREVGAAGVYLDEFGFGRMRCYSTSHGHPKGIETLPGEMAMTKEVRRALDTAGLRDTMIYIEETPPDAAAPYYDAAFCYDIPYADRALSPLKLNLWRFAFPDVRLWDMLSIGIDPRVLSAEDFRLSLWHGNGVWLKGHSETWYGEELLSFIRRARQILKQNAAAFAGVADPLVNSPHPAVFINRFSGGGETVYTLFNASYQTVHFIFEGRDRTLGPRDVDVIAGP